MDHQVIECRNCGASNRVSMQRTSAATRAVCGRCKAPLAVSPKPLTITDENFADVVEGSSLPVLLDLWAEWCGPCHMIAPTITQLAAELAGQYAVGKLNIDENPRTATRLNVGSIPTLLIFKNGQVVDRIVGVQPKAEILRRLSIHQPNYS